MGRAISTRGQATFAAQYQDTLLLLVRVEEDSEVLAGLASTTSQGGRESYLPTRHLEYNTETVDQRTLAALLASAGRKAQDNALAVRAALAGSHHFVVPLRKRAAADQISSERISVGRATNKDIVLRDATVSKFHAWFELYDDREFSVTDAGSTNKTAVNGEELAPRTQRPLVEGDRIKFGSVLALFCSAETLWSAIHDDNSQPPR